MIVWISAVLCAGFAVLAICLWHGKTRAAIALASKIGEIERLRADDADALDRQAKRYEAQIADLNDKLQAAERRASETQRELAESDKKLVTAEEARKSSERLMNEREAHYQQTLAHGKTEFESLAQKILEDREKKLKEDGTNPLNALVNQLKQDMEALKTSIAAADKNSATTHTQLMGEITKLMGETGSVTKQANFLAEAIRGDAQFAGEWGEIQLKRVLDLGGLTEGIHYTYQETFPDAETGRKSKRTDFVIKMPKDGALIIDSKSTVAAAERYHAATDDDAKKAAVSDIIASVRGHVDEINSANYQVVVPHALPTVLMYIPLEEVYMMAMKATISVSGERELLRDYARRHNVVFVNSTSVIPVIRLIEMMCEVERSEKNRLDMIRAAEELLQRANDFVAEFLAVGDAFKGVFARYEAARGRLVDSPGGHSITKAVAKLVKLGASPTTRGGKKYELAAPIAEEVAS